MYLLSTIRIGLNQDILVEAHINSDTKGDNTSFPPKMNEF